MFVESWGFGKVVAARGWRFGFLGFEIWNVGFGVLPSFRRESSTDVDTNAPRRVGVEIVGWEGGMRLALMHLLLRKREHILLIMRMYLQV